MIFIKVLFLLTAHDCFKLSEGQILSPGHKEATGQERQGRFKSQVLVEVKESWLPVQSSELPSF